MEKEFKIDGMSCLHCVKAVEKELEKLELVKMQVEIGTAQIEFDQAKVSEKQIINSVSEAGYRIVDIIEK